MKGSKERLSELFDVVFTTDAQTPRMLKALKEIVTLTDESPLLLWEDTHLDRLSKASLFVLFCNIIDNEDDEIKWALRSFAYTTQSLINARKQNASKKILFDLLKNRVMLLHSHDDFFFETLEFFLFGKSPQKTPQHRELNQVLRERVNSMIYKDLLTMEEYIPDMENDEMLAEITENIEEKYNFTDQQLTEAQLLSDTLFKYVWYCENK